MGKKLIKGCIFGGLITFVWMMLSWMVLPWHCWTMNSFDDEEAVASVLMENVDEDGIYVLPNMCEAEGEEMEAKMEAIRRGPFAFVSIKKYGYDFESAAPFVFSLITQLVGAFIVTYLLLKMAHRSYWQGVWCVTLIGFLIGFLADIPTWNWWGFPFTYVLIEIADMIIAWFLAGLTISAVTKK